MSNIQFDDLTPSYDAQYSGEYGMARFLMKKGFVKSSKQAQMLLTVFVIICFLVAAALLYLSYKPQPPVAVPEGLRMLDPN